MKTEALPDKLVTGIESIDKQHLKLIATLESILECLDKDDFSDEIDDFLSFLASYTKNHFDDEEEKMFLSRYPGYEQHKYEHGLFRMRVETLENTNIILPDNKEVMASAVKEAKRWLFNHVMKTDVKMAEYLKAAIRKEK